MQAMNQNPQNQLPEFHALIVAAGGGQRFNSDTPKQFIQVGGKSLLAIAVERFADHPQCQSICVVHHEDYADTVQEALKGFENIIFVLGGDDRKLSVFNGLNAFSNISNDDLVLIHDAARPCVSSEEIDDLLSSLISSQAASLAVPITGTVGKSQDTSVSSYIDREGLWSMQTPQGFRYGDILKAHAQAKGDKNYTDDTSLVSDIGIPVKLVQGKLTNIKVTYQEDLAMAEAILNTQAHSSHSIRVGQGFDVHAFDAEKLGPVRLCGIDVEHSHALKGHSDADVGLHTLTDAIFGAIGEGDIGQHFPPSDDTYKDMDSAVFLERAKSILRGHGGELENADVTLICEDPKVGPHASKMRQRVAEICQVEPERINIKATTTEKLGFTGRKEGIAAQAIVSVRLP